MGRAAEMGMIQEPRRPGAKLANARRYDGDLFDDFVEDERTELGRVRSTKECRILAGCCRSGLAAEGGKS